MRPILKFDVTLGGVQPQFYFDHNILLGRWTAKVARQKRLFITRCFLNLIFEVFYSFVQILCRQVYETLDILGLMRAHF